MKIDRNDLLHIESCALIVIVAGFFLPWWGACALALGAGIGKEVWDKHHGGVPTWSDIVYDMVGIMFGMVVLLIEQLLTK